MKSDRSARAQQMALEVLPRLILGGISMLMAAYTMKWVMSSLDPSRANRKQAAERKRALERRLKRPLGDLNQYEDTLALEVVDPDQIDVSLEDVGGLKDTVVALRHKVLVPLEKPQLFASSLLRNCKGVLLYGPPGTGKTLIAKALAKEGGACFINIKPSTLLSKWFGDTSRLVHAIFSLAHKLAPCIIFVDEVDALLGKRRATDHEASTAMKTEFMSLWDGFLTPDSNVTVLAATNRRQDLDAAVLRRFPVQYHVGLPSAEQRVDILRVTLLRHDREARAHHDAPEAIDRQLLNNEPMKELGGQRPLHAIAARTEHSSGSDLYELCSQAAAEPIHDLIAAEERCARGVPLPGDQALLARGCPDPLAFRHFDRALENFSPSGEASKEAALEDSAGVPIMSPDLLRLLLGWQHGGYSGGQGGSNQGASNGGADGGNTSQGAPGANGSAANGSSHAGNGRLPDSPVSNGPVSGGAGRGSRS